MDLSILTAQIDKLPRDKQERALEVGRELSARKRWKKDPLAWMEERLGLKREMVEWSLIPEYANCHCRRCGGESHVGPHAWDGTVDPLLRICQNVAKNQWTAVEGGTGTSKTYTLAALSLWFLDMYEDSMVLTTAPKERQLEINIWQEIQRFHPQFNRGLLQSLQLKMEPPSDRWIMTAFVAGVKASEAEGSATKAQGIHRQHLLIIFEETPGIHPAVMKAFMATCTAEHNIIVALGNPDHQLDTLHQFAKSANVDHVIMSGFDHPNVVTRNPDLMQGAQTEMGLDRLLTIFKSPDNPLYLSRARGISPGQSTDSIVRLEWIRIAQTRPSETAGVRGLGVDVANSSDGDLGAICEGIGATCIEVEAFPCPDANELGRTVAERMTEKGIPTANVAVDGIGVGAGTVNELKRLDILVVDIQSANKPIETMKNGITLGEQFDNLRSQMWWQVRLDLQDENGSLVLPNDDELIAELTEPKYKIDKGKIKVEPKSEIKKRLGRSTNKADAFVYWNWVRERRDAVGVVVDPDERELSVKERQELEKEQAEEREEVNESFNMPRRRSF